MDPRLNEKELQNCPVDWPASRKHPDQKRELADIAIRKMLTWAIEEIKELATHMHELPHKDGAFRAGVELAAEEIQERARLLGIEPWESTNGH